MCGFAVAIHPREGTGNLLLLVLADDLPEIVEIHPREGTETLVPKSSYKSDIVAIHPREGTET